jgi:RNA polymerase sigma factor (sigma-70 family)
MEPGPGHGANGPADRKPPAGLTGAAAGEFERIYGLYHAALLAYVRRRIPIALRGLLDPQDIVQETFLAAFRHWRTFEPGDAKAPLRWLMTIARRCAFNARKAQARVRRGGMQSAPTALPTGDEQLPESALAGRAAPWRTPEESAIASEDAEAVERAIAGLPPHQQRAARLHFIEGQCIDAVAADLGRSAGAINLLCNRAKKAMKDILVA